MTKLLLFYENFLAETYGDVSSFVAPLGHASPKRWIQEVLKHYRPTTLQRLLASRDPKTQRAAIWALRFHGDQSHYLELGHLLNSPIRITRKSADDARRAIASRTQSPWHRLTSNRIEELLAKGLYVQACQLADQLVAQISTRSDAFSLRACIRFASGEVAKAAEDCKSSLRVDPFAYQSYVALGQCYWHMRNDGAARECYLEAARIYPDWKPAHSAIELLSNNS